MSNTSYSDTIKHELKEASTNVNELLSQVDDYQEQQGLILESLKKIEAQAYVALSDDFLNYNSHVIHYYLCALSNNIEITTHRLEELHDAFIAIKKHIL
jgi:hypothetical protein